MNAQEFEFSPPGKFAQLFPLLLGLVFPLIILALFAGAAKDASEWRTVVPALLLLPIAALFMAWRMHRRTLRLEDGILKYGRMRWLQTAVSAIDLDASRIVNLEQQRELRPFWRIAGTAMPGYRSGFFRLRDKRRAYVVVTDPRRVLVLPKRDGGLLMFSLVRPQALLDALRRATDDKAGSAR